MRSLANCCSRISHSLLLLRIGNVPSSGVVLPLDLTWSLSCQESENILRGKVAGRDPPCGTICRSRGDLLVFGSRSFALRREGTLRHYSHSTESDNL